MQSYLQASYPGILSAVPRLPTSLNIGDGDDDEPGLSDMPRGQWNPFNVKSPTWASGSLLTIAREHHAAVDRLQRAGTPLSPMRGSSRGGSRQESLESLHALQHRRPKTPQKFHSELTQNRQNKQWPRGVLPMDRLHRDASVEALSPRRPFSRPASGPIRAQTSLPALKLYPRELRPSTYYGASRVGMPYGNTPWA